MTLQPNPEAQTAQGQPTASSQSSSTDPDSLAEYRKVLVSAEQKAQDDFDKAVMTLSGGALGVSFAFVKDLIPEGQAISSNWALLTAWICWGSSLLAVLFSFFLSHMALRKAIRQVDDGSISTQVQPGGPFAWGTAALNVSGAALFFIGVCLMTFFAAQNLEGVRNGKQSSSTTSGAPAGAAPTAAASAPATSTSTGPTARTPASGSSR